MLAALYIVTTPAGVLWLVGGCYAALLVQRYDYEVCG